MTIHKDQYFKALDMFDSENSRFWTRFNIFTGLQLLVVAGFASNYNNLLEYEIVGLLLLFIAFVFSIFTLLITIRSRQISLGIFNTIVEIEKDDETLTLMQKYIKTSQSPMGVIARYCVYMSWGLAIFWILFIALILIT